MPNRSAVSDELKRRVRQLKKLEVRIRFGNSVEAQGETLVWDAFFDLHEPGTGRAKYSLRLLSVMSREEYKRVVEEFFSRVYNQLYEEIGLVGIAVYDPAVLARLDLPSDADEAAIKRRFHELALQHHPDTGGDAAKFIELMGLYRTLIGKGK